MKRNPADKWFSLCVRIRASWKCERCGKQYSYPDTSRGLDCAHYQTRDEWATRYHPLNAFALCRGCHGYFDRERRFEFEEFYLQKLGPEALALLREKARDPGRLGKAIKQTKGEGDIAEHYEREYYRLLSERSKGTLGRLEFYNYERTC